MSCQRERVQHITDRTEQPLWQRTRLCVLDAFKLEEVALFPRFCRAVVPGAATLVHVVTPLVRLEGVDETLDVLARNLAQNAVLAVLSLYLPLVIRMRLCKLVEQPEQFLTSGWKFPAITLLVAAVALHVSLWQQAVLFAVSVRS
jgi:hypothetical protein